MPPWASGDPQTAMMVSISVMMRALLLLCSISRKDTNHSLIALSLLTDVDPDLYTFESVVHGRSFDIELFSQFVEAHVPIIFNWSRSSHYLNNKPIIELISRDQLDLWDYEDLATARPRSEVFIKYAFSFSHQQATERAKKDQNLAASHNRGETNIKARICGQALLRDACVTVLNGVREAYRGKQKLEK
jgi:hypothetical protein